MRERCRPLLVLLAVPLGLLGTSLAYAQGAADAGIIDVRDQGARGTTVGCDDGAMKAGMNSVFSETCRFTPADVGKSIVITGSGVSGAPQIGVIDAFTDTKTVKVSFNAETIVPWYSTHIASVAVSQAGPGSYVPMERLTVSGADPTQPAEYMVTSTQVVRLALESAGSGGTKDVCTITGVTGTGVKFQATGRLEGGGLSSELTLVFGGNYSTNPANLHSEPVAGCGLRGASVSVVMGVLKVRNVVPGHYPRILSSTHVPTISNRSGTGATLNLSSTQGGGQIAYGPDDSASFASAIKLSNSKLTSGTPVCIHISSGIYFIKSTPLPIFTRAGCLIGEGNQKTILYIDPSYSGDIFSWTNAWNGADFVPFNGETPGISQQRAGPIVRGITVFGDRRSLFQQNAFVFYDHTTFLDMSDVNVFYLNGRAFAAGMTKFDSSGYMAESRLNMLRFHTSGRTDVPVMEFNSTGGASEVRVSQLDIYGPQSTGLMIRGAGSIAGYSFLQTRIEGTETNPFGVKAHLLQIGDHSRLGTLHSMTFTDLELLNPYANYCALNVDAPTPASQPFQIVVTGGSIGGGSSEGKGVCVNAGRDLAFNFSNIATRDANVTIGGSPLVGNNIFINGYGTERRWTYRIDPTSLKSVITPVLRSGDPRSP